MEDLGFPVLHPAEAGDEYRPQRPKLAHCLDKEANFWKNGFEEPSVLERRMRLSDSVPYSEGAGDLGFWEGREALG